MIRRRSFALVIIFAMLCGTEAHAAVYVWDGGASSLLWGDANNWNPNGVPPKDSEIQFNGGITTGSTINMNTGIYGLSSSTTIIDLNNGEGFIIDLNNWAYWPTINVQDANDYTLQSNDYLVTNTSGNTTLDVVVGGTLTLNGGSRVSGSNTATLLKTGDGTMYLTGGRPPDTSTINQTVQGGVLSVASVDDLGTGWVKAQTGGTFEYTGTGAESRTGQLHLDDGDGIIDVSSTTGNLTFNVTTGSDLTSGAGSFSKTGPGTLTLATSGADMVLGKPVVVDDGILAFQANGANSVQLQDAVTGAAGTTIQVLAGSGIVQNDSLTANWSANLANLDVAAGGTLDLGGNNITVDALTGAGSIINSNYQIDSGNVGHTLTVGANDGTGTFSGTIDGSGTTVGTAGQISLVKIGDGTQILTGDNIYAGGTYVNDGILLVNNTTGSGTGSGPVTVIGGLLGGEGILGGDVDVQSGAVSAGDGQGTLAILGNYSQSGGSMLTELGGPTQGVDYDWIEVGDAASDTADISGRIDIDLIGGFAPSTGDTFDILTALGGVTDSGITLNWDPAQLLPTQSWTFSIVNLASGQALRLEVNSIVVPEPSSAILVILGLLGLGLFRQRRRAK